MNSSKISSSNTGEQTIKRKNVIDQSSDSNKKSRFNPTSIAPLVNSQIQTNVGPRLINEEQARKKTVRLTKIFENLSSNPEASPEEKNGWNQAKSYIEKTEKFIGDYYKESPESKIGRLAEEAIQSSVDLSARECKDAFLLGLIRKHPDQKENFKKCFVTSPIFRTLQNREKENHLKYDREKEIQKQMQIGAKFLMNITGKSVGMLEEEKPTGKKPKRDFLSILNAPGKRLNIKNFSKILASIKKS